MSSFHKTISRPSLGPSPDRCQVVGSADLDYRHPSTMGVVISDVTGGRYILTRRYKSQAEKQDKKYYHLHKKGDFIQDKQYGGDD